MEMILPRNAYEAFSELIGYEEKVTSYKSWASQYFKDEDGYQKGKMINISTYIEMLLVVTACLDGEINSTEIKSIQFLLNTKERYITAKEKDRELIKTSPPALIYNAYAYQNETNEVVLPDILKQIKILIEFVDQLNGGEEGCQLFDELKNLYKDCLDRKKVHEEC